MLRAGRSSLVTVTGLVLLAATLVCPLMATAAAAAPVAASCHERPDPDDHGGALGSVACCAGVLAATPLQPAHEDGSAAPFGLASGPGIVPPGAPLRLSPSLRVPPPPLFVHHAVLRI